MDDEPEGVEELLDAMRERARSANLPPPDFVAVQASMRRIRRRRWIQRGIVAVAVLATVSGLVALLLAQREPGGGPPSTPTLETQSPQPRPPLAMPSPAPVLERLEPFAGVVAFVTPATRADFPSPERMVLASGTAAIEIRSQGVPRKIVIETPGATIVVTGTVLSVSVESTGTCVEVLRGRVEVKLLDGPTVRLEQGQMLRPGRATPEALTRDRVGQLLALFPDEPPSGPVAGPEPVPSSPPPSPPSLAVPPVRESGRPPEAPPAAQGSVDETYRQAEAAMRNRDYATAAALLRKVLEGSVPGSSREEMALIDLADVREQLGDAAGQREALEQYLGRHLAGALREDARDRLCRLLQRTGSLGSFESCLEEYLAEFPTGRRATWARGMLAHEAASAVTPTGDGG